MGKQSHKSVFIGDDISVCYRCGKMCMPDEERMEEHHIFGGAARRSISDKYGLLIHVCRDCHNFIHGKDGKEVMKFLHEEGQRIYEERYGTREKFIEEFIRSYL